MTGRSRWWPTICPTRTAARSSSDRELFAAALVLTPAPTDRTCARTHDIAAQSAMAEAPMADAGLEALRIGNPAARALPLLAAIAAGRSATIWLEAAAGTAVDIVVEPG